MVAYLTDDLVECDEDIVRNSLLSTMAAVVYEQPHKIPLLAGVIHLTNLHKPSVGQFVVEMVHTQIQDAIDNGNYNKLKLFMRFLAALYPVVGPDATGNFLSTVLARAIELQNDSDKRVPLAEALFVAVLLALPIFVHSAGPDKDAAVTVAKEILESSKEYKIVSNEKAVDMVSPFVSAEDGEHEAPYEAQNFVALTRIAVEKVDADDWRLDKLIGIPALVRQIAKDRDLAAPQLHTFPAVNVPAAAELKEYNEAFYKTPRLYFRSYMPAPVESVPAPDTVEGVLMRDISLDIIANMDFNRKEVTRQLITLDLFFAGRTFAEPGIAFDRLESLQAEGVSTWKVEDVAVEAVLDAMFHLPDVDYPNAYLHAVLIEACVMAPQAIAPVFGRAIRFIFRHIETLDAELFFRFIDWFSQHLSNFAFTWKWKEWLDYVSLPEDHPKRVFIQQLILKEVRLSYPQRVRETLPEEYLSFVPDIPEEPSLSYLDPESPYVSLCDQLVAALKSDVSDSRAETIITVLTEIKDKVASVSVGGDATAADEEFVTILISTLCHAGNRSPSHARTAIEKTADTLRENITTEGDRMCAIRAVRSYWKDSPANAFLILDFLADHSIIERDNIVDYVLEPKNDVIITTHGWEALTRVLDDISDSDERSTILGRVVSQLSENLNGAADWQAWWHKRLARAIIRKYRAGFATIKSSIDMESLNPVVRDALTVIEEL